MVSDWRPGTDLETLRLRARLLAEIRAFFAERGVLEVETPMIGRATATDPHLQSLRIADPGIDGPVYYLQTSPEFFMKRLLAAGSGPIYQIAKAFRAGESGALHNPEFTMLEWYRPGMGYRELMDEVAALVAVCLELDGPFPEARYRELFRAETGLDPVADPLSRLTAELARHGLDGVVDLSGLPEGDARNLVLDLLFSHCVQPRLGTTEPLFVYDFPACQAALARLRPGDDGRPVAERFELFHRGIELANGYQELTDAREQRRRFAADLATRRRLGLPTVARDERLCAAIEAGLPECSGVAVGVDRLLLCRLEARGLDAVIAFVHDRL